MCSVPRQTLAVFGFCVSISLVHCARLPNVVDIQVAGSSEVDGGLFQIEPANITAENDTFINFIFNGIPGTHKITQSSVNDPCSLLTGELESDNLNVVGAEKSTEKPLFPFDVQLEITEDRKAVYSIKTPLGGRTYEKSQQAARSIGISNCSLGKQKREDVLAGLNTVALDAVLPRSGIAVDQGEVLQDIRARQSSLASVFTHDKVPAHVGSLSSAVFLTLTLSDPISTSNTQFQSVQPQSTQVQPESTQVHPTQAQPESTQVQPYSTQVQSESTQVQSTQLQSTQSQSTQAQSTQAQSTQAQSPQKIGISVIVSILLGVVLSILTISLGLWYVRTTISKTKKKRIATEMVNAPFGTQQSPSFVRRYRIAEFRAREKRDVQLPPGITPPTKDSDRSHLPVFRRDSLPAENSGVYLRLHEDGGPALPSPNQTQNSVIDIPPTYSTIGVARIV